MDAEAPRLCLVLEEETSRVDPQDLIAVLDVLDAATLVLVPGSDASRLAPLVTAAQGQGVAVLIEGDRELARRLGADGVHLSWQKEPLEAFEAARQAMGPERIVGADAGRSRHDAMEIGEAGADYVAFGIPRHVEDRATAFERQLDLIAWWVDLFEVPVVGWDAASLEDVAALAERGADFIAVRWPEGEARPMAWAEGLRATLARACVS